MSKADFYNKRAWIQDHLEHPGKIILLAEADGAIIGSVTFEAGNFRRVSHRGNLGLAVVREWRSYECAAGTCHPCDQR